MDKINLGGVWQYRIGRGAWGEIRVPYSAHPVGHSEVKRLFDCDMSRKHVFLRFEGITYAAEVFVNGVSVGKMLAYAQYDFEITHLVKEKDNELLVLIEDITPVFGPSEGWQNYGGIIHDAYLLYAGESYIEDVFFSSELKNGYKDALVKLNVKTVSGKKDALHISLLDGDKVLFSEERGAESLEAEFIVKGITVWLPENPKLYTLRVLLADADGNEDTYEASVGFKEFAHDGKHFYLNGEKIFLAGVCRHEMIGESGHTPAIEDVERDFRLIKEAGMNYVRLVHYPHDKRTLDIADRMGLLVSEEPGLWWSDTANREIHEGSIEVLRRTIRRDRNHVSVAFWLCFNECRFTETYLIESAKACREEDPTRLVSGANCMSDEDTVKYYEICGFDFYTMHPYAQTFDRAAKSAKVLQGKPLLFTEWGGHFVYDNPKLIREFIESMISLYKNPGENGTLAGATFWEWAEMYEFGRGTPACIDGILKEGLVDINRNRTMIYDAYKNAWAELYKEGRAEDAYEYRAFETVSGMTALACENEGGDYESFMQAAHEPIGRFLVNKRVRKLKVGPKLQKAEEAGMYPVPLILDDGIELVFGCGREIEKAVLLGGVSLPKGYPIAGEYGESVMDVVFEFEGGEEEMITLTNGADITCAMTTFGPSKIYAASENGVRFAEFNYDRNHENYKIDMLRLAPEKKGKVLRIRLKSSGRGYKTLVYGLFV